MKSKWVSLAFLALPLSVFAQAPIVPLEPQSIDQAVGLFQTIAASIKTGEWLVVVVAIVNILVFAVKKWGDWLKIPSAWRVPVVTGLGLIVTVLAHFISGGKWDASWALALLSGPVAVWVHQLVSRIKGEPKIEPPK